MIFIFYRSHCSEVLSTHERLFLFVPSKYHCWGKLLFRSALQSAFSKELSVLTGVLIVAYSCDTIKVYRALWQVFSLYLYDLL